MAYDIWIRKLHLPVAPEKIQITVPSTNEKITLSSNQEYVIPKRGGLRQIEFEVLLPNQQYPFAEYYDNLEQDYIEKGREFKNASIYLAHFDTLKSNKMVFQLLINRRLESGEEIYSDNITVVLEEYTIVDNAENGYDTVVSLKFCEFVEKDSKVVEATNDGLQKKNTRESKSAPKPPVSYTVVKGDSLWKIAKKYYNDGNKWTVIAEANKDTIKNPSLIYVGQVIKIPQL